MPAWDAATRQAFLRSEQALVSLQLELAGRTGSEWAAWRQVTHFAPYGELLAAKRFAEIEALVQSFPTPP
jgi:muconolactone delta-isomerase